MNKKDVQTKLVNDSRENLHGIASFLSTVAMFGTNEEVETVNKFIDIDNNDKEYIVPAGYRRDAARV